MRLRRLAALLNFACIKSIASASPRASNLAFTSFVGSTSRLSHSDCSPSHRRLCTSSPASITQTNMSGDDETDLLSKYSLPKPLILASSSFTRKLILRQMNVPFHIMVRSIDEKAIGDRSKNPRDLVLAVARAKMDTLINAIKTGECSNELPSTDVDGEYVVLTGDQVITCDGTILEKPADIAEAKRFVKMYASHPPSTVGSIILTHYPSGITVEGTDKATIYFKPTVGDVDATTNLDLVDRMLKEDAPILSCAGGLMIEHPMVREYIEQIDGTEDSVMGLSKDLVERLLGELKTKKYK